MWHTFCDEVLVEGPAGTGKTRGLLERAVYLAEKFPNSRQLFVRQTLKSLRQSVLVTFEDEVLFPGHPLFGTSKASKETRTVYKHRHNGAEIVLGGMDTPDKYYSAQYDVIWLWEAREFSYDSYEKLARANRNGKMPFQQRILDTNPWTQHHWINKYFPEGRRSVPDHHPVRSIRPFDAEDQKMRLLSRHVDNPGFYNADGSLTARGAAYIRKLDGLTGARRRNLRDGEWASDEGMVWPYKEEKHLVDPESVPHLRWYFGSFDQGMRDPSCLQVWGVDDDDRMYRVAEVYRCHMDIDWWAGIVAELDQEFLLKAVVCDHAPEWVKKFNDFLAKNGRPRIARNANKDRDTGIELVKWALSDRDNGPHIFFVRGALRYGKCPERLDQMKPTCFEEEVHDYVWEKSDEGKRDKERPDPLAEDHACDATRYAAMFRWKKDLENVEDRPKWEPGTLGHLFKHDVLNPRHRGGA